MTARLTGRRRAARAVIDDVGHWAVGESRVLAVALVGSYARSAERMGSDVDILILSDEPDRLADAGWFQTLRPRADRRAPRIVRRRERAAASRMGG
jgi:predicted nucleotidyltransferase